jgi:hypothetical protein
MREDLARQRLPPCGTNTDGLRMKITDSSGTVYDNLQGATNDLGNTQILAGGEIKIHS